MLKYVVTKYALRFPVDYLCRVDVDVRVQWVIPFQSPVPSRQQRASLTTVLSQQDTLLTRLQTSIPCGNVVRS